MDLGEDVPDLAAEPGRLYAVIWVELVALDPANLEVASSVELSAGGGESTGLSTEGPEPSGVAIGEEGVT